MSDLIFLKLGGSLITDKTRPRTARPETLARLAGEIAEARRGMGSTRLLIGHGSGSFGHAEAHTHGTAAGVRSPEEWLGFAEVWAAAAALNRLVLDALRQAGLPAISFPPSAAAVARDGEIVSYETRPLQAALDGGLLPIIYGDVVVDEIRGGAVVSTEALIVHVVGARHPLPSATRAGASPLQHKTRILLAGVESGVYADYPSGQTVIRELTPQLARAYGDAFQASGAVDVTGGMRAKVATMLQLVERVPGLTVHIFSGETPGLVRQALLDPEASVGTRLRGG